MNTKLLRAGLVFVVIGLVGAVVMYFQFSRVKNPDLMDSGAIARSHAMQEEFEKVQERAREFSLSCLTAGKENCVEMLARAEKNPELKTALLQAKAAGVLIIPSDLFAEYSVGDGWISINLSMSDERIVALLTK